MKPILLMMAVLMSGCSDIERAISNVQTYIPANSEVIDVQYSGAGSITWIHFKWNGRCYLRRIGGPMLAEANCTKAMPKEPTNED